MSRSSSARDGPTSTTELDVVVLDASVLVELVVAGRHARAADALIARYGAAERLTFVTAAHGLVEATNVVRKLVFRGLLTSQDGLSAVQELGQLDIALDTTAARLPRIWSLRDRMSAYDAAYAAAADALRSQLVTVDERLLRACRDAGIPAMNLDALAAG
jgi:predicted nucleic acid-binding protein